MMPFEKCPVCGGELEEKEVEKLLRGGDHTAVLRVEAEVCLHCGERLYAEETVRLFEQIRNKLKRQQLSDFVPLGQSFVVDRSRPNKANAADS
ncbi:MAG: YgiT-type zinc finger protein [Deltaproteobacteria bacterium]|nr:YgiT-type zinc finger protein [Deltaproteobacteria bacterium]MBW2034564.1 YgiT-type zinc finger protein [Deltaproteobacteria bacterium]MBW2119892.1 YgiT-type zinc finger protein [Deltaproteobacteria bacterium]MBW2169668.1 YgiT-type zinc finger protein [Deltaproteobacteria bacterium]